MIGSWDQISCDTWNRKPVGDVQVYRQWRFQGISSLPLDNIFVAPKDTLLQHMIWVQREFLRCYRGIYPRRTKPTSGLSIV
jgi:hypothetical protein